DEHARVGARRELASLHGMIDNHPRLFQVRGEEAVACSRDLRRWLLGLREQDLEQGPHRPGAQQRASLDQQSLEIRPKGTSIWRGTERASTLQQRFADQARLGPPTTINRAGVNAGSARHLRQL